MVEQPLLNHRYLLSRQIGEGGMGSVFLVRDTAQGHRPIALKILRREALDPESVARFRDEFRAMARLRHPNLAEVHDFETLQEDGRQFLTMEYVEGKDLGSFRWADIKDRFDDLAVQCLRALDYIHARGLLHHDIKPGNIMVRPPFEVKLLDFGLAQSHTDPSRPGLSGTIHFIAPERLKNERADARSDLYGLGVVLYQIAAGVLPFVGEDPGQVIGAILRGRPRPPRQINPSIPERMDAFIMGLLERDPGSRPASAAAALDRLNRGLPTPFGLDTPETYASCVASGQFIGRDAELTSLLEFAAPSEPDGRGQETRPRLVVVSGPGGIGKSRLMRELKHRLQTAGIRCLTGRCYEDSGVPFQSFVEILRQAPPVPGMPEAPRAALDRILPKSASTDPDEAPGPARQDPGDKVTFVSNLASGLDQVARGSPGVVFLEDLHWSDAPGIDLLERLLSRKEPIPWRFVGSLRDEEARGAPVGALLERYRDTPRMRRMELKALAPAQVVDLIASMLPFQERPEGLAGILADRSEGNPLYIEELMKSLAEEGALRRSGGAFLAESRSLANLDLPAGLAGVVARRVATLNPAERELAEQLAVFNRPVGLFLLARALGIEEAAAKGSAEALAGLGLLMFLAEQEGPPAAALVHSRIREPIYKAMTDDRRRALHLAAGNAVEEQSKGSPDAVVEELAHHFSQAGERARAAEYNLLAARKAKSLFNLKSEATYLRKTLEFLPVGEPRRLQILMEAGEAMVGGLLELEGAVRYGRLLGTEARRAGDKSYQAAALRIQALALEMLSDTEGARSLLKRALPLAKAGKQPVQVATCFLAMGIVEAKSGGMRRAIEHFDEARRIGKALGLPVTVIHALNNAGSCLVYLGEPEAGIRHLEEARAIARKVGLMRLDKLYLLNLASARLSGGDTLGAIRDLEEALAWSRDHEQTEGIASALEFLGLAHEGRGSFDRAIRASEEDCAVRHQQRDPGRETAALDLLGQNLRALGRREQALEKHEQGLALARTLPSRTQEGFLLGSLALDEVETGHLDSAAQRAKGALAIGRELAHYRIPMRALAALALIAIRRGNRAAIVKAAANLRRIDSLHLKYHERVLVRLILGRCALALGKHADAAREARAGLALAEKGDLRESQWQLLALLGDTLGASGLPRDATSAYNSAHRIIRQIASEIEDEDMRQDYEQDPRREEVAQRSGELSPATAEPGAPVPGGIAGDSPLSIAAGTPARMLTTIYEITQIINSILDLRELLNRVMDLAIEIVRAERGLVFLYRSETDEMEMVVARNMEKQTIKDATEYSRNILKQVGHGRPILSHDAAADSRFKEFRSVSVFHIRSLLCVPLRIKDRVIGTVYVDTRQPGVVFNEDDQKFLEAFANQAAVAIENARLYDQIRQENQYLRQAVQERYGYENIVGRSAKMREVFALLSRVAQSNLPVLIRGESGTGKELVARAVHHNSARKDQKFFSENCAALPDTLLESELFGHMKGAFTGAESNRRGLFELAHGGTLFLDEVGDMSMTLQSKLLRVLQDGEVRPVGSESSRHVDVRIISATNRNLEALIKEKKFREDLYFRLNVIGVTIPALRDRRDDTPLLVDHFLGRVARENNSTKLRVDPAVMALLTRYDWPGNVRELENAIYRLALFAGGDTLTLKDAKSDAEFYERVTAPGGRSNDPALSRSAIEQALSRAKGNREEAARILGISRATMFRKMRQHDLAQKRQHQTRRQKSV